MANDIFTGLGKTLIYAESTYGTDAVETELQSANALVYQELETVSMTPNLVEVGVNRRRDHMSGVPSKLLKDHLAWEITGPLLGAVTPGTNGPAYEDIFLACGMSETVSGGATFKPTTNINAASVSIYDYQRHADSADSHRLVYGLGARGNVSFSFNSTTEEAKYTASMLSANVPESTDTANFNIWSEDLGFFDSSGVVQLEKDGATDPTHTAGEAIAAGNCILNQTGILTVDSQQIEITGITLDMGITTTAKQVQGDSNGVLTSKVLCLRTGRIGGAIEVAETGAGFEKLIDLLLSASQVSATYVLNNGSTGADRITLTIPKLQIVSVGAGDSAGFGTWNFGYACNANDAYVGDDDFTLVYDAVP